MSLKQAKLYDDWEVKVEHIMISLINDYNNNAIKVLEDMGVDVDVLHKKIEKTLIRNKKEEYDIYETDDGTIPLNPTSQNIIKGAEKECDILEEDYLDTQHIVLSLLKTKNAINRILKNMKITYKTYNDQ
jgi:ATP-dependent Clp protease ATP-binding subunit ClpA